MLNRKSWSAFRYGDPGARRATKAVESQQTQNKFLPLCRPRCELKAAGRKSQKKAPKPSGFRALVRTMRFELTRSPTRPSNVRVCQFRHVRVTGLTGFAIIRKDFCACQVLGKHGDMGSIKLHFPLICILRQKVLNRSDLMFQKR